MMAAYYNEHDPFAAAWLRNLIAAGHIAPGDVDERDIREVRGDDLRRYTQVHFFAGIGGWSAALRLAGWPDDDPVWSGSCPCQPFSGAGQRRGTADERHLWPEMRRLVSECGPGTVFGEQVASADGRAWLAGVRAELEELGYGVGAVDCCAAGIGAPHIRQRLWWVADAGREHPGAADDGARTGDAGRGSATGRLADAEDAGQPARRDGGTRHGPAVEPRGQGAVGRLADAGGERRDGQHARLQPRRPDEAGAQADGDGDAGRLEHAVEPRLEGHRRHVDDRHEPGRLDPHAARPVATPGDAGFWRDADWIATRNPDAPDRPVWRRVEPGSFPLAHGLPAGLGRLQPEQQRMASVAGLDGANLRAAKADRIGRLKGYGNAIVRALAAEFIAAFRECRADASSPGTAPAGDLFGAEA